MYGEGRMAVLCPGHVELFSSRRRQIQYYTRKERIAMNAKQFMQRGLRKVARLFLPNSPPARAAYQPCAYPSGINLHGFLTSSIGIGQGARLYAKALEVSGIAHALLDANALLCTPSQDDSLAGLLSKEPLYDISVLHINPDMLPDFLRTMPSPTLDRRYLIGVWLWELERIPESWQKFLPLFDEWWAPSRFIQEAMRRETDKPVTFMPYGIEAPIQEYCTRASFGLPENTFLVLCMFDTRSYISRKNPAAAVAAFQRAFENTDANAMLVLKTHNATKQEIADMKAFTGNSERVILLNIELDKKSVNSLILCCDTLISLHRSEGFGLIMAEAMALSVPVVATNWSSNTDFMDESCACMVDYTLIPTEGVYMAKQTDQHWADADVAQAAGYLKRLYTDAAYRKAIASAGAERIRREYSIEACAARIKVGMQNVPRHSEGRS